MFCIVQWRRPTRCSKMSFCLIVTGFLSKKDCLKVWGPVHRPLVINNGCCCYPHTQCQNCTVCAHIYRGTYEFFCLGPVSFGFSCHFNVHTEFLLYLMTLTTNFELNLIRLSEAAVGGRQNRRYWRDDWRRLFVACRHGSPGRRSAHAGTRWGCPGVRVRTSRCRLCSVGHNSRGSHSGDHRVHSTVETRHNSGVVEPILSRGRFHS